MSSRIDIENLNKESDERDQIDKGDQFLKNGVNVEEVLTVSDEVLKLGLISYQSFIEQYSDERDQKDNDDQIEKK